MTPIFELCRSSVSKYWNRLDSAVKGWIFLIPFLCAGLLDGFETPSLHISSTRWILKEILFSDVLSIVTLLLVAQIGLRGRTISALIFPQHLSPATVILDLVGVTVALFFATTVLIRILYGFFWPLDQIIFDLHGFDSLSRPYPEKALWTIEAIFLRPIYEELIFRGVMRELFLARVDSERRKSSEWGYIFYSSLLFGACHWEQGPTVLLTAFFTGMLACKLYIRMGYLLPIIIAHGVINAISIAT